MRHIIFLLILCLLNLLSTATAAPFGERIAINSNLLKQERQVQVLLPESYNSNPSATYPVIYLLDGDYNIHGISGMLDMLANKGQLIPDVILVAIADKGTESYRNFMTPNFKQPNKDSASLFASHLITELKPYIQKHYRAAEKSILIGQSIGGLFVLNTLVEQPTSFTHYTAVSPSVWVGQNAIVEKAQKQLLTNLNAPVSLYLSLGDETRMGMYDFINVLDSAPNPQLTWQFKHYPDENHNSVGLIAIRNNLKHIFKGWHLAEQKQATMSATELVAHYHKLLTNWHLKQPIPGSVAQSLMRYFYRNKQVEKIPQFVQQTLTMLPQSQQIIVSKQASYAGHFDSPEMALAILKGIENDQQHSISYLKDVAKTYQQLNQPQKAKLYYKKALNLALKQNANQWQLNIIKEKL